jgi:hypothetical protein
VKFVDPRYSRAKQASCSIEPAVTLVADSNFGERVLRQRIKGREFHCTLALAFGLLVLLFAAPTASAETWSGYRGGQDGNAVQASKPASRLGVEWRIDGSLLSERANCVSYGEGAVFTTISDLSGDVRIIALSAADGQETWTSAAYMEVRGCPVFVDGVLYASTQRKSDGRWAVAALEADDGGPVWEHLLPVGRSMNESVRVSDNRVVAVASYSNPGTRHELIALDATDGNEAWSLTNLDFTPASVVAAGEQSVVVVINNELRAYDIADGTNLNWPVLNGPQIRDVGLAGVIDDGHYFGTRQDASGNPTTIVGRDLGTGAVNWARSVGAYSITHLVADDARVYAFSVFNLGEPAKVTSVSRGTGEVLWNQNVLSNWYRFFLLGNRLYVDGYSPQESPTPDGLAARWSLIDPASGELRGTTSGFFDTSGSTSNTAYGNGRFFEWRSTTESTESPSTPPFELVSIGDTVAPEIEVTAPATGSYKSATQALTWTADDGVDTTLNRFEVSVNGAPPQTVAGGETSLQLTSLSAGANTIEVKAVDLQGNESTATRQITVVPSPTPVASLVVPPAPVLSGSEVTLDAGSSTDSVLDGQITGYEWDLDGNGSFETEGGSQPTIQTTPSQVGTRNVAVKVTNDSGNPDTASGVIDVRRVPPPGSGVVGVSINEAATFTNDPNVKLTVVWPALASDLAVSNDGGFASSDVFPLPANGITEWTLDDSGPERLPKTVYLRYYGAGSDLNTYTDDIILDRTAPVIEAATAVEGAAAASVPASLSSSISPGSQGSPASTSRRRAPKRYRIRLRARDATSGVVAIQAARSTRAKGPVIRVGRRVTNLRKTINPRVRYRPKLVRVKDAAGNWSRFRRVR